MHAAWSEHYIWAQPGAQLFARLPLNLGSADGQTPEEKGEHLPFRISFQCIQADASSREDLHSSVS
jgi:hypothetical protein